MNYIYICFFLILPLALFSQTEEDVLFEKGETLFYKRLTDGTKSHFKQADSIFSILKEQGDFSTPLQEIATELYLLRIRYTNSEAENRNLISELIKKYNSQEEEDTKFYNMLLYWQQFFRHRSGNSDAEAKILTLIDKQLAKTEPDYELVSIAYDNLSRVKTQEYDNEKGAEYGEKAITYYKKTDFTNLEALALQFTGGCYHWLDKTELSLAYMEEAYTLRKTLETPNALALSGLAFNIALINEGQLANKKKSINFYKESIDYRIEAEGENSEFLIMIYSLLADVYFTLKDIEQAEYYAQKAQVLANDILKTESVYYRSFPAMSLSRIYTAKGDIEKARRVVDNMVEDCVGFYGENDKFTIQAFIDKANVELADKQYEEAETYLLRALKASEAVNRVYSTTATYQALCNLYLENGNFEKALEMANASTEIHRKSQKGKYIGTAEDHLFLVRSYLGLKDYDQASAHIEAAKEILDDEGSDTDIVIKLRALFLENRMNLEKYKALASTQNLNRAYNDIESFINEIVSGKASFNHENSKMYYSEFISAAVDAAIEIADIKYAQSQDNEGLNKIFKLMELNKSSILLDGIIDQDVKTSLGVPDSLTTTEASIKSELVVLNKDLYILEKDTVSDQTSKRQLVNRRLILNKRLDSIYGVLQSDYPAYSEAVGIPTTKSLSYYQTKVLQNHQCLVEYFIGKDAIYRITLTTEQLSYDKIALGEEWEKTVSSLYRNLTERKETEVLAADLGALLLPEFPSTVTDIIFVPDGALSQIPFEIMPYKGQYLMASYNVSYAGSLQLYEKQKKIGKEQSFNWVGFAPEYEENTLYNNKEEVLTIGKKLAGNPIIGKEATKDKMIEIGEKSSILHLAAHTELDKINPMLNKILFSDSETSNQLTASEIYGLKLHADLVVLSACNTGTGLHRGDGVMSMSRAFTYAGTSSTLMSLWKVPDSQTSEMMVLFYDFLNQGQPKNEALRNAKLSYLKQVKYEELAHPFYWAGFVLSGDESPVQLQGVPFWKENSWMVAIFVFLLLIVLVYLFLSKKNKRLE